MAANNSDATGFLVIIFAILTILINFCQYMSLKTTMLYDLKSQAKIQADLAEIRAKYRDEEVKRKLEWIKDDLRELRFRR